VCGKWLAEPRAGERNRKRQKCQTAGETARQLAHGTQAQKLLSATDVGTLLGKRDTVMLALLVGCGLRRAELVGLQLNQLQRREDHWVIVDLVGKGGRLRTVPVPDWCKWLVDGWLCESGVREGTVLPPCVEKRRPKRYRYYAAIGVGHREAMRETVWDLKSGASRSSAQLRAVVSWVGRGT
jgi:integrase